VAAALRPGATVASIIDEALAACQAHKVEGELSRNWHWYSHVFRPNEELIEKAVEIAARHHDVFALRTEYYDVVQLGPLGSEAGQTLAVALGMLVAAGGNLRQAIIGCVNYGRDNDSYATVAGAIAGALHGTGAIPSDWRQAVEAANPKPDMHTLSLGLTRVAVTRHERARATVAQVEELL
jgi:ADP-ribosylglycohydrolase